MEFPEEIREWIADRLDPFRQPWRPVNTAMLVCWSIFFLLFIVYSATREPNENMIHLVWLPIHEGGHLFFGWFGWKTLMVAGGTLMQLLVPLALAVYFAGLRQPASTAFCSFMFFENFIDIAQYMADARAQDLPLVTVGDPGDEPVEHDFFYLFDHFGVLNHDTQIAAVVRFTGWLMMAGVVAWFTWRWWQDRNAPESLAAGA